MPDGSIRLHLGLDPDDNPNDPAFDLNQQIDRLSDAHLQAQHTRARGVKFGLEAYKNLAELPFYEVGGAAAGEAFGAIVDVFRSARAGIRDAREAAEIAGEERTIASELRQAADEAAHEGKPAEEVAQLRQEAAAAEQDASQLEAEKDAEETLAQHSRDLAKTDQKKVGCFVAGTLVLMGDGHFESIEQVKVGDLVSSKNETTGEVAVKKVLYTSVRHDIWTREITFSDGNVLETTDEHPLYIEGSGFHKAKEIGIGSSIVTRAGPAAQVTAVQGDVRQATVYNFTVDQFHTYFIGHGRLWEHNIDCQIEELDLNTITEKQEDSVKEVLGLVRDKGPTPTWVQPKGHWGGGLAGDDEFATFAQGKYTDLGTNPRIYDLDPSQFPAKGFPRGAGRLIINNEGQVFFTDDHYESIHQIDLDKIILPGD